MDSADDTVSFILSEDMAKSLTCTLCENYLSVPPITIISEDGKKYKCGRCRVKSYVHCRAFMYEKLAKCMSFPCIYSGCTELVQFKDAEKHEAECEHKIFKCVALNCKQELLRGEFLQHVRENHEKLYYKDSITLKNVHSTYGLCVLEFEEQCYILLFDYDASQFGFSVSALEKVNKQFEITLSSPETKVIFKIKDVKVELFDQSYHCYECIRGVCKLGFHPHKINRKAFLKNMRAIIEKEAIYKTFGKSTVTYKIDIVDEKVDSEVDLGDILLGKEMIIDEVDEEEGENEQDETILKKQDDVFNNLFQCSTEDCKEQLSPPIFQCLSGHSVCSNCKSKTGVCASCQSKIESTRNFALEDIDTNLKQSKKEEVIDNEKTIKCPMIKCLDTFLLKDVSEHFLEKHTEHMHYNVACIKNIYGYSSVHVLVKNEKTYLLFIDFNDVHFGISLYSLNKDHHQYEITLSSANNKYSISATRQKICQFDEVEHCFRCLTGYCKSENHPNRKRKHSVFRKLVTKFPRDYIRRMFETGSLNYKVKIVEPKPYIERDKVLRQALECPICKDYMLPPIHQCLSGHTLCHLCVGRLGKCPTCEAEIGETHNVALETAANAAEISCQNVGEQCAYRATLKKITVHEFDCRKNGGAPVDKRQCLERDITKS